jgi:signal transduction histidine kinase
MVAKDSRVTPERDQTDKSLRAERHEADQELVAKSGCAEERAREVVDRAREQADDVLEAARTKAASKLESSGASVEVLATAVAEWAEEDTALATERRTADLLLEAQTQQRRRALASLLDVERAQTDKHLLLERALVDEMLARIFAELAEAVRLRDEFVALASHELNTPLTSLSLRLQSLARETARHPNSPFARHVSDYIGVAQGQVKKFSVLVADLLDVSRIASSKLTFDLGTVDFGAIVLETVALFGQQAAAAGIVVEVDAPGINGCWDELLLERMVCNLLENAIKFGRGKPIRVRLQATAEAARLTVQDEGIGIAAENLSRIFGRFERAVSSRNYGGLGLGLYVCRTIVEAMGGTIAVQSELGKGSTFTVDLPLSGPRAAP